MELLPDSYQGPCDTGLHDFRVIKVFVVVLNSTSVVIKMVNSWIDVHLGHVAKE